MEPRWTAERGSCRANKPTVMKCPGTETKILSIRIHKLNSEYPVFRREKCAIAPFLGSRGSRVSESRRCGPVSRTAWDKSAVSFLFVGTTVRIAR